MSEPVIARMSLLEAQAPARAFSPRHPLRDAAPEPAAEEAEPDVFALGLEAGQRVAEAAFAEERMALRRLIAAADALQPEPSEELAAMIAMTVERLVTELVDRMPVEPHWLAERINRAMTCLSDADAARTLRLHPADIALLDDAALPLDVVADASLERGALRIDCAQGWIEEGRSRHLDALRASLGIGRRS